MNPDSPIPPEQHPTQTALVAQDATPRVPIPFTVAVMWGVLLQDGLSHTDEHPHSRRQQILQTWQHGRDALLHLQTQILHELQQQLQAYHTHPFLQQMQQQWAVQMPTLFEYLVVLPLGRVLGNYILLHHGKPPEPAVYAEHIRFYLLTFFPQGV